MSEFCLASYLQKTKERLININITLNQNKEKIKIRTGIEKEMTQTYNDYILNKSNKIIKFNVGGTIFSTFQKTILSSNGKDSLLEGVLLDKEIDKSRELFFDRNPFYFNYILNYLRNGELNIKLLSNHQWGYLLNEAKYFQIHGLIKYIKEKMMEIEFVSFHYSGAYFLNGEIAGTNLIEDIKDKSVEDGGICVKGPGHIIFELNSNWEFNKIEIKGYSGNSHIWNVNNGSGASIYSSIDKKEWILIGKIPIGFGNEVKNVNLLRSVGRFIKFESKYNIGIGYLKVYKIDES